MEKEVEEREQEGAGGKEEGQLRRGVRSCRDSVEADFSPTIPLVSR